jgi:predicted nucleic-acid-binding protein
VIGIDTNILIRHLDQDDPIQSPRATRIIEHLLTEDRPGFISLVTIAEIVWVLRSIYRMSDAAVATAIEQLLQADTLAIQNEREVYIAMMALRNDTASFDDALIGALGTWAGCTTTCTFDRKAARLKEFKLA